MPLDQAIRSAIAGMASRAKAKSKAKAMKAKMKDKDDCKSTGMGTKVHSKNMKKGGMHNYGGGISDDSGNENE